MTSNQCDELELLRLRLDSDQAESETDDERQRQRAHFDLLMTQFEQTIEVLETIKDIATRVGNREMIRVIDQELFEAATGRKRLLRLFDLWWRQ